MSTRKGTKGEPVLVRGGALGDDAVIAWRSVSIMIQDGVCGRQRLGERGGPGGVKGG